MSLLNIYLHPGPDPYALVGVDTESLHVESGRRAETSKLVPIVHLNAVLAFRGAAAAQGAIATAVMGAPLDLESWLEHLGECSQGVLARMDDLSDKQRQPRMTVEDQEIALVGWSPTQRRFVGRVWKREKYEEGFRAIDFNTAYIIGGDDEQLRSIKTPTNPYAMGELAKLQCRRTRELEPGVAVGGRFIVAWLREDHMRIEAVCQLPARESGQNRRSALTLAEPV